MIVNAFYINEALGEIMGDKACIIACNATVGSPIDGRHVASARLGITSYGSAVVAVDMLNHVREVWRKNGGNLECLETG